MSLYPPSTPLPGGFLPPPPVPIPTYQLPIHSRSGARLAIITPWPSESDTRAGRLLSGAAGYWLDRWLEQAGLVREACFVASVSPVEPPNENIATVAADVLATHWCAVLAGLRSYGPDLVICLGDEPWHLLKNGLADTPPMVKGRYKWPDSIWNWRGSVVVGVEGFRLLPTFHPSTAFKKWETSWFIRFDLARAASPATYHPPQPPPPVTICTTFQDVVDATTAEDGISSWLRTTRTAPPLAIDIEGGVAGITAIALSQSGRTVSIGFCDLDGEPTMTEKDEVRVWAWLQMVLESPVPKVLQNAAYDAFVLAWSYGIHLANIAEDTLFKMWEWKCELPKDLGTITSIFTTLPYYKGERKAPTLDRFLTYNGMDAAITALAAERIPLTPDQDRDYRFRVRMIVPFLYMSLHGWHYDRTGARIAAAAVREKIAALQVEINALAGVTVPTTLDGWVQAARTTLCLAKPRRQETVLLYQAFRHNGRKWVKDGARRRFDELPADCALLSTPPTADLDPTPSPRVAVQAANKTISTPVTITTPADIRTYCKESCREVAEEVADLLTRPTLPTTRLTTLLGLGVNVDSTGEGGDCQRLLYETWNLPRQFIREAGRPTTRLTTDDDALLAIYATTGDLRVIKVLRLRRYLTELVNLEAGVDSDNRMRCGYSVVGPKSGRTAAYESPTGSGYNLQTTTKSHRRFFLPPPGMDIHQYDLAGADAWTVAAWAKKFGDDSMFEDLRAGIKPHAMVVLMRREGNSVNLLDRANLRAMCKKVDKDGWEYAAGKKVVHMSNYLGQERTMSASILKDSCKELPDDLTQFKPLVVPSAECKKLQDTCFFQRYWGVGEWHSWWQRLLEGDGEFTSTTGHKRQFLGKRLKQGGGVDRKTHGEALAHEPQFNTTLATLLAIWSAWSDPDNRITIPHPHQPTLTLPSFRARPIHSVHDSAVWAAATADREWVKGRAKTWFNHPLTIAGQEVLIPVEGECGPNWGMGH